LYDISKEGESMNQESKGKLLSRILRHQPEMIGMKLDEHGWLDVDELLEKIQIKTDLSKEELEQIVANDKKQRYSFDASHTRIRANQGHSIPVDVQMEQAIPPDVLYHGTALAFVPSIKREGIKSMSRLFVHLSADQPTAIEVGRRHGEPVLFKVDAKAMHEKGYIFYLSKNHVWQTLYVPPEFFELLEE
jgi:putative RNA 2'-phosphotransferase